MYETVGANKTSTPRFDVNVQGSTPNNVPNLPWVVRVHCTRTYPRPPGRPIRDQESVTTNHKSVCGVVEGQCMGSPPYNVWYKRGVLALFGPTGN